MGFSFEHTHVHTRHTKALAPIGGLTLERQRFQARNRQFWHQTAQHPTYRRNAAQTSRFSEECKSDECKPDECNPGGRAPQILKKQKKSKKALR